MSLNHNTVKLNSLLKPKTLIRTLNSILLSWENVFSTVEESGTYILEIENVFHEWKILYWGPKKQFLIDNLTPGTFYNFRLKCHSNKEWLYFKNGTESIPYFVMHFTRAVKFSKTSVIRKIISRKPVLLETENKEGKTPLIQAIEGGNLHMVTFLINLGANVNAIALVTKRTPLMVALFNSQLQIASLLIDRGANLTSRDCNLLNSLHHAVDSGSFETVKFCLNYNFDINAKDSAGWSPLLRAVVLNCSDSIISLLLQKGADITIKDKNGFDFFKHLELNGRINLNELIQ